MLQTYGNKYEKIYSSKDSWKNLFQLIALFNSHIMELGFNAFVNRENVSKVKEDEKISTNAAVGLLKPECIDRGNP